MTSATGEPLHLDPDVLVEVRVADDLTVCTFAGPGAAGDAHYLYHEVFTHDDYLGAGPPLPPDAVVVDAGANIGLFTLRVLRDCPDARVHAIEPVPAVCALLRRNTRTVPGGPERVRSHAVALGARSGSARLRWFPQASANSTTRPEEKPPAWARALRASHPATADAIMAAEDIEVPVVRLSDVWPPGPVVDLLKIDVEGAELDVLRGVDDAHWPGVARVVVEVQDVHDRLARVCALLAGRGLRTRVARPARMPDEFGCHLVHAWRS